ncbi:hypothetical protein FLK61_33550 [Paenalkalicoccus suaedae]|uniref:Uncharacterized protein n=1 Tax=Paenalkalicoccus suaedae TaxID=2592382 RepID=A0A859FE29_9BACI|nr:hypothetical protein [Paenalkalicoccus suaedae]QKS71613.1 hypothetical protein FLK61_33550 [Paenalkalicoccus suaedae]
MKFNVNRVKKASNCVTQKKSRKLKALMRRLKEELRENLREPREKSLQLRNVEKIAQVECQTAQV